ncbi:hypothetical protein [Deinococcus sp. NW-56]|uniref:hypothetical protein n=1 Tax=Deinococcus sp. NW-56 TaxID=2080419 RepID=UPI000CF4F386|nr:hypothetical protein [Deinococcus sp. NW-56]
MHPYSKTTLSISADDGQTWKDVPFTTSKVSDPGGFCMDTAWQIGRTFSTSGTVSMSFTLPTPRPLPRSKASARLRRR